MMLFRLPKFLRKRKQGFSAEITTDMDKLRPLHDAFSRSMSVGGRTFDTINRLRGDPHIVAEVMCWQCGKRWIAAFPANTLLKQLQCPGCDDQGYAFMTSQDLDAIRKEE